MTGHPDRKGRKDYVKRNRECKLHLRDPSTGVAHKIVFWSRAIRIQVPFLVDMRPRHSFGQGGERRKGGKSKHGILQFTKGSGYSFKVHS